MSFENIDSQASKDIIDSLDDWEMWLENKDHISQY